MMYLNNIEYRLLDVKKLRLLLVAVPLAVVLNQGLNPGTFDSRSFAPVRIQTAPRLQIHSRDIKLLWALNRQEASGKAKIHSRYEPGFYRKYIRGNKKYAHLEKTYGARAVSSSYGPWQIMYLTAHEMGYRGKPQALSEPSVSLPYVIKYLDFLRKKLGDNERAVISAYNAGPGGVGTNPGYTSKVIAYLKSAPSDWQVHGTS
jgi:hypothetical protein